MNRKHFLLVLAAQTALLLALIAQQEYRLAAPTTVLLETAPVDPRDLLRGDYVILNYKVSTLPSSLWDTAPAGIGAGDSGCFISKAMENSWKLGIYLKSFGTTREELQAKGDAHVVQLISRQLAASKHVGQAILLAMDGVMDANGELDKSRTEIYVPNEFIAKETAKTTNLLYGASINPLRKDALAQLDWAKANGARLVKWIPSIMQFDPADERLTPFYRKLVELKLPLLTHAGQERSFTSARDELCDPQRLHLPLKLGVTVIVAHIASTGANAGQRDTDRLAPMMATYTNLFSEISSLTQVNKLGYLREALTRPEWSGRLLFGSDFPLINTPLCSPYCYPLNLTAEQCRRISAIENPWDRDVELKQALGVPREVFERSERMFRKKGSSTFVMGNQ